MRKGRNQVSKLAALIGAALWATAEALAQENLARPARRIVVSIPDRKLAVLEGSRVVKVLQTAVGAPCTPSPTGSFTIVRAFPIPLGIPRAGSFRPANPTRSGRAGWA